MSNKSVCPKQEKNPKGEVHEDLGFFSYDRQRKRLFFRQFHVEGFVNEYVEQDGTKDGKTLVFETERIENIPDGWRARETYKILSQDEYIEVFELAEPQKEFAVYSESHWKREGRESSSTVTQERAHRRRSRPTRGFVLYNSQETLTGFEADPYRLRGSTLDQSPSNRNGFTLVSDAGTSHFIGEVRGRTGTGTF